VRLSRARLLVDDVSGCFRLLRDDLGLPCTSGDVFQAIPSEE